MWVPKLELGNQVNIIIFNVFYHNLDNVKAIIDNMS